MGYVGRIVSVLVIWLVSFAWIALLTDTADRIREERAESAFAIAMIVIFSLLSWQLGKKYDEAKYFSEKDELTGTYNRRYIQHNVFKKLSNETWRKKQNLCLFIIDIDDLKEINDTYGHLDGDDVIRKTALLLNRHTRKTDIVARWGGDEFIVAAPDTSETQAEKILDRIEKEAASYSLGSGRSLQLSAGYALYPNDGKTLDELIQKADERMYARKIEMKQAGPNKHNECETAGLTDLIRR